MTFTELQKLLWAQLRLIDKAIEDAVLQGRIDWIEDLLRAEERLISLLAERGIVDKDPEVEGDA